jgi:hypothetical protein
MQMKKSVLFILAGWVASIASAATLSTSGDWNTGSNWDTGLVPGATDQVVINGGRTATIQTSDSGEPRNILLGANSAGMLVVTGTLDTAWNDIKLGVWGSGNGTLQVLGGTVGASAQRQKTIIGDGAVGTEDSGTLQIGNGTVGGVYYTDHLYMFNNTGMTGSSLLDIQSGTLDATGKSINIGYLSGTAATAQMKVSNDATIDAGNLLIGVSANNTSGKLTINGNDASFNISGGVTLSANSEVDLNFDDGGITALTANKLWYANGTVDVNITGTENVTAGVYELFVGTTGGSGHGANAINFNIDTNSFGAGATLTVLYDTDGGREAFSLEVSGTNPTPPEIGDISLSIIGTNAVVSFDGATGFSYALQRRLDLAEPSWSNVVTGISGAGGSQSVSNAMSGNAAFYRIVSE